MTSKDPTEAIRLKASSYDGVDEGTACTQSSFKAGKKAFLFIGMQGGRYKAMFKLESSRDEANRLAEKQPDDYQVGSTAWVTARFSADKPMPKKLWSKWLDESYNLSVGTAKKSTAKAVAKKAKKKTAQKKTAQKKSAQKKSAQKKSAQKKSAKKKTAKRKATATKATAVKTKAAKKQVSKKKPIKKK